MCICVEDAQLGLTSIAGWRLPDGRHVVVYGNEPKNEFEGPNALILHIPAHPDSDLDESNFLPTDRLESLLDDMWAACPKEIGRGARKTMTLLEVPKVIVFQLGIYKCVLARHATPEMILAAIQRLPKNLQPNISRELIEWYQRNFPGDALLIACFNRARGEKAEPIAVTYYPQNYDLLRLPAVDAHGEVPQFGKLVKVRHRLIIGSDEWGVGGIVRYSESHMIKPELRQVLPSRVIGAELIDLPMPNGDFVADLGQFRRRKEIRRQIALEPSERDYRIALTA